MKIFRTLLVCLLSSILFSTNLYSNNYNNSLIFSRAIVAHTKLQSQYNISNIGVVIDFTKPSNEKRLYVIDFNTMEILATAYVAHGRNSGMIYSSRFSNRSGSLQSSIGVYITKSIYYGSHGRSLQVEGLEYTNSHAFNRAIVFHPASYVSENYIKNKGRAGRSWGCFALDPKVADSIMNLISNRSMIFAYYPDQQWLNTSKYLSR